MAEKPDSAKDFSAPQYRRWERKRAAGVWHFKSPALTAKRMIRRLPAARRELLPDAVTIGREWVYIEVSAGAAAIAALRPKINELSGTVAAAASAFTTGVEARNPARRRRFR
jgi:hypothetical protein